jgi:Acetyl-CoA carboxylase, central region
VPTPNAAVHVYEAVPKKTDSDVKSPGKERPTELRKRFFVRALVRQIDRIQSIGDLFDQFPGPEVRCAFALAR